MIGSLFFRSLVGSRIGSQLSSFVEYLIGCWNRIKWLTPTWFLATGLRLVNACAYLPEWKLANSTKNFKRAGTSFNLFHRFEWCPTNILKRNQIICLWNQAKNWYAKDFQGLVRVRSDKLWGCLTAACKAFNLANAKEKGTDGLVIRSLDD